MTCLRLAEVYLTYLQTQFYIHRLLAKGDASCSPHLVQTCSSLIELSLEIGGYRSQTVYDVYRNFRASTVGRSEYLTYCLGLTYTRSYAMVCPAP